MISLDEFKEAWETIFDYCGQQIECEKCPIAEICGDALEGMTLDYVAGTFTAELEEYEE